MKSREATVVAIVALLGALTLSSSLSGCSSAKSDGGAAAANDADDPRDAQKAGSVSESRDATENKDATAAKDPRALAALKEMSDTLANAKALAFRADSTVPIASPTKQWVHVFGASQVTLRRPDRLYVETGGDVFNQNFYFDGKTVTMYAPTEKLYATEPIPGNLDDALKHVFEKHGTYFSFADVILALPHEAMVKDLASAQLVGESKIGGVATTHLAFAKPGMEWELWVGAEDHLPRRLDVTYTAVEGRPTGSVTFADWKLNPDITADPFAFTPPQGAARIEFRKLESSAERN